MYSLPHYCYFPYLCVLGRFDYRTAPLGKKGNNLSLSLLTHQKLLFLQINQKQVSKCFV